MADANKISMDAAVVATSSELDGLFRWKDQEKIALEDFLKREHCFTVLPTGSGQSLIKHRGAYGQAAGRWRAAYVIPHERLRWDKTRKPLRTPEEEAATSCKQMADANEISADVVMAAGLSELNGIFKWKDWKPWKQLYRISSVENIVSPSSQLALAKFY